MTTRPKTISPHPFNDISDSDRLRISWFRTKHLPGHEGGKQVWVVEAFTAMDDEPVAYAVFEFTGSFHDAGMPLATQHVTQAGFDPAAPWHLSHDAGTWSLDSLRPTNTP